MRVTTAFKRLVRLDDVNVPAVEFLPTMVVVTVALRRRRLVCPHGRVIWGAKGKDAKTLDAFPDELRLPHERPAKKAAA